MKPVYSVFFSIAFLHSLSGLKILYGYEFRADLPGYSMYQVPVTDQGDSGFCYAYAAAQMLDAFRYTYDVDSELFPSSPVHLALNAYSYENLYSFESIMNEGGLVCDAVNAGLSYGLADDRTTFGFVESIRTHQVRYKKFHSFVSNPLIEKVTGQVSQKIFQAYKKRRSRDSSPGFIRYLQEEIRQILGKEGGTLPACFSEEAIRECLDRSQKSPFSCYISKARIAWSLTNSQGEEQGPWFLETPARCENFDRLATPVQRGSWLLSKIKQEFNKGKKAQPVAVTWCPDFMGKKPARWQGVREARGKLVVDKSCNRHVSLIVGRYKEGRDSGFLLRDSYGEDCGAGRFGPLKEPFLCDRGQIWITEAQLLANLISVSILRTKS